VAGPWPARREYGREFLLAPVASIRHFLIKRCASQGLGTPVALTFQLSLLCGAVTYQNGGSSDRTGEPPASARVVVEVIVPTLWVDRHGHFARSIRSDSVQCVRAWAAPKVRKQTHMCTREWSQDGCRSKLGANIRKSKHAQHLEYRSIWPRPAMERIKAQSICDGIHFIAMQWVPFQRGWRIWTWSDSNPQNSSCRRAL
jgi:hypothetical protein